MKDIKQPTSFELHINSDPDFTKKFGKKVKAIGGHYRACRGYQTTRFVHIPNTEEGRELAQAILDEFAFDSVKPDKFHLRKTSTVISRGLPLLLPSWAIVHYTKSIDEALSMLAKNLESKAAVEIFDRLSREEKAKESRDRRRQEVERLTESLRGHPELSRAVEIFTDFIAATAEVELSDQDYIRIIEGAVSAEYQGKLCPKCGKSLSFVEETSVEHGSSEWYECEHCGYSSKEVAA